MGDGIYRSKTQPTLTVVRSTAVLALPATCLSCLSDRGLTSLIHDELRWLDVPERVTYKMSVIDYRCLHGQAPRYLADHFTTSSDVAARLRLRSANRHQLIVPCCRRNTL